MRYAVTFTAPANHVVEVEADTTDADEIAALAEEQLEPPELCRQCGHTIELGDDWAVTLDDKGAPTVTRIKADD